MDTKELIIEAKVQDYTVNAELIYEAGSSMYNYWFKSKDNAIKVIQKDFVSTNGLLSHKNALNILVEDKVVGIVLCYKQKEFNKKAFFTAINIIKTLGIFNLPWLIKRSFLLLSRAGFSKLSPESLYVAVVAILPEYRGHGYGRSILKYSLDQYQDYNLFYLDVATDNDPAINLYKSVGFEIVEESVQDKLSSKIRPAYLMKRIR